MDKSEEINREYRNHLVLSEQKAQEDYDKTVIFLSGGALGISFAFVKDIVGTGISLYPCWLFVSWIFWGLSVTCTLASYYFSTMSLRRAIKQVDEKVIYNGTPGGYFAKVTSILNVASGLLFLSGVVTIIIFIYLSIKN